MKKKISKENEEIIKEIALLKNKEI